MSCHAINRRTFIASGLAALSGTAARPAFADLTSETITQTPALLDPNLILPSQLRLGQHLIRHLAGQANTNIMVSPASLAGVLAMLSSGASQPFQDAIHHVLGFGDSSHRASAQHVSALKAAIGHTLLQANGESPLALANMIVFDPNSKPYFEVLAKLSVGGADVSVEDLRKIETIDRINEWVAQRTRNLIPSILNDPMSHPGLVALNALYFKDKWKVSFDPAATKQEKFHLVGGKVVDAAMMSAEGRFRFRQNERFIAVELPYASDDFKLVVVTTKTHPARANEFMQANGWLGGQEFIEQDGFIALPRVSMSSDLDLLGSLDVMGLSPARLRHDSFRRFTAVPQMLSRIVQKAELRIDEEGTEAAAVTAATTWRSAPMVGYTKMVVNKPFAFALRDKRTGFVLLDGYVGTAKENL